MARSPSAAACLVKSTANVGGTAVGGDQAEDEPTSCEPASFSSSSKSTLMKGAASPRAWSARWPAHSPRQRESPRAAAIPCRPLRRTPSRPRPSQTRRRHRRRPPLSAPPPQGVAS
eukprot:scaffold29086_cov101-Isochrysis_galbana.AAC.4